MSAANRMNHAQSSVVAAETDVSESSELSEGEGEWEDAWDAALGWDASDGGDNTSSPPSSGGGAGVTGVTGATGGEREGRGSRLRSLLATIDAALEFECENPMAALPSTTAASAASAASAEAGVDVALGVRAVSEVVSEGADVSCIDIEVGDGAVGQEVAGSVSGDAEAKSGPGASPGGSPSQVKRRLSSTAHLSGYTRDGDKNPHPHHTHHTHHHTHRRSRDSRDSRDSIVRRRWKPPSTRTAGQRSRFERFARTSNILLEKVTLTRAAERVPHSTHVFRRTHLWSLLYIAFVAVLGASLFAYFYASENLVAVEQLSPDATFIRENYNKAGLQCPCAKTSFTIRDISTFQQKYFVAPLCDIVGAPVRALLGYS